MLGIDSARVAGLEKPSQSLVAYPPDHYVTCNLSLIKCQSIHKLVLAVEKGIVWIRWIGTHKDYDKIDVNEVEHEG
jgi:mRNA-degrading endonuclease HigB of HigAB toxin-antitoxin module